MLYFLLSDNQVIIQDCIDELKSTEVKENTVSYLGRMISKSATFFSKANFSTKTEKMESKLDEALVNLQKANYLTLSEKDLVPLGDLKKAVNGSSLPDAMQFKKAEILKIVDRLEEIISKKNSPLEITIGKTYSLPLEIIANITSFTTDSKLALTAPAFLQAKQDMAKTTAEACQRSPLLKEFLPGTEELLLEFTPDFADPYDAYVKFVFKSIELGGPLFTHPDLYDAKKEELKRRYGDTMPIQLLEEFALWRESLPPLTSPNLRMGIAR